MPPSLALLVWFMFLVTLWRLDPAKERETSPALWVPVIWIFFVGSRLPSQWLGGQVQLGQWAEAMQEGNALDRSIFSLLMLLAFGILMSRPFDWGRLAVQNAALMAFLSFALLSVFWSDFPFVSLK